MKRALATLPESHTTAHLTAVGAVHPGGRPIVLSEPWSKVTIVMEETHVVYLDLVSLCIRAKHHRTVSRAELLRAFVEFMERSEIDLSQFKNADEVTAYLVAYFRAITERGRLPLLESGLFNSSRAARNSVRRLVAPPGSDVSPSEEQRL